MAAAVMRAGGPLLEAQPLPNPGEMHAWEVSQGGAPGAFVLLLRTAPGAPDLA